MRALASAMLGGLALGVACAVITPTTRIGMLVFILLLVGIVLMFDALRHIETWKDDSQ